MVDEEEDFTVEFDEDDSVISDEDFAELEKSLKNTDLESEDDENEDIGNEKQDEPKQTQELEVEAESQTQSEEDIDFQTQDQTKSESDNESSTQQESEDDFDFELEEDEKPRDEMDSQTQQESEDEFNFELEEQLDESNDLDQSQEDQQDQQSEPAQQDLKFELEDKKARIDEEEFLSEKQKQENTQKINLSDEELLSRINKRIQMYVSNHLLISNTPNSETKNAFSELSNFFNEAIEKGIYECEKEIGTNENASLLLNSIFNKLNSLIDSEKPLEEFVYFLENLLEQEKEKYENYFIGPKQQIMTLKNQLEVKKDELKIAFQELSIQKSNADQIKFKFSSEIDLYFKRLDDFRNQKIDSLDYPVFFKVVKEFIETVREKHKNFVLLIDEMKKLNTEIQDLETKINASDISPNRYYEKIKSIKEHLI